MNEIRALLQTAARRLEMTRFLGALHVVAIVAAAVALILALVDRAPADSIVAWRFVGPALAVLTLAIATVMWSRRRADEAKIALVVDERLDLRERLSTALHVHQRDDAFAQAAVADAITAARDPRTREVLRRRFRVGPPSTWWIAPLIVILACGVLLLPQANLFAGDEVIDPDEYERVLKESDKKIKTLTEEIKKHDLLESELAGMVDDMTASSDTPDNLKRPEQVKREALKKVTQLSRKLDEIISGEKGKTAKTLKDMLSKVATPESGPAKELAKALAEGRFDDAQKELEKIAKQLQNGDMDAAAKKQLAEQMKQLGDQLEQIAQQQQQLQQALQQAGLPPQLANNPQALQQALQQAQNLNEEQKQQLQQMMQAQQAAQQMCQGLGQACQQMGQGKMGQGMQNAGNQLNDMEQLQQLMQQAQAAMNQCQGQQGLGNMGQMGGGMGQRGQGAGGDAKNAPTPFGTKMQKADAPITEGEIIASMLIDGTPITGESKAKLKDAVTAAAPEGYDEAMGEDPVPPRYREAHQHYFGELQKRVEAVPVTTEDAESASDEDDGEESTAEDE